MVYIPFRSMVNHQQSILDIQIYISMYTHIYYRCAMCSGSEPIRIYYTKGNF